ncbi:helix-turn-helix domain-containing protein [Nocardia sp. NPDC088792]|uniref:helix-turn-helix domain-containing protein n=1 Tax=Nocardia sp. NPDC088792 TaxID=3364332 RepID=UPI0037FE7B51
MDRGSLNRAFGQELRDRRKLAGMTAEQMWTRLRWRRNTYRRTESGERDVTLADVFDVAEILNISPTTIFAATKKRWQTGAYPNPSAGDEWREILGL